MAKATGTPVTITAVRGHDVLDVVLVAPDEPDEPDERGPTAEETERARNELCDYWTWEGTRMVALTESISANQTPGTDDYEDWQRRVQDAKQTAADSRKPYCDAE
jgi:hypothetical protein